MGKLFGTDGVRGVAGKDLTCELALQIGRGTAAVLTSLDGHRPKILIGKDTRVSGDMLESTLAAGLCSVGADVELLGVIPTPGVAYLVRKYNADAGIMISASHNPMEFNGIKIFKGDGYKLPDEVENQIEAHVFNNCTDIRLAEGADIGRIKMCRTGVKDYVDFLQEHIDADLTGLKVLFDCANGASARVAQELFPRLGCECGFIGTQQDGVSVNDGCGSTHLETLEAAVKQGGYDCGIAFDGDADRCLACDENGAEIDGDKIIALVGTDMKERGRLDGNTVVVTVMSNLGFMKYMQSLGIETARTGRPLRAGRDARPRLCHRRRAERSRDLPASLYHRRRRTDRRQAAEGAGPQEGRERRQDERPERRVHQVPPGAHQPDCRQGPERSLQRG